MKKYKSLLLIVFIFIIDLVSKLIISNSIKLYKSVPVIKNFFYLTYTKNRGAAFGILEGKTLFILVISLMLLIYLLYELFKKKNSSLMDVSLSFIIGGLLSNLSDRLFLGCVRDFLHFKILGHDFAIFNIGDIFIVVGSILFLLGILLEEKHGNQSK